MDIEMWLAGARVLVLLAAFSGFAWAFTRMRRESAEQLGRLTLAHERLRAETHAIAEKMSALTTLVASIPARLERSVEPPPPPAAPRRESAPVRSYETAKRLARSGATVEEIVATCGIAGTEARLLRRLHGSESRAGNAA